MTDIYMSINLQNWLYCAKFFITKIESMNLMKFKSMFSMLLFLVTGYVASAKIKHPATGEIPKSSKPSGLEFIENKGQWTSLAKYRTEIPGGTMFITKDGFMYVQTKEEDLERIHEMTDEGKDVSQEMVTHFAYQVSFVNSNENAEFKNEEKSKAYNNYFIGNDRSKWASNVGKYGKVNINNLYKDINLIAYSKGNAFKYDFVVAAGANTDLIKMSFKGVKPSIDKNGDLIIKTAISEVKEQAPYCYQEINGQKVTVASKYVIDANGNIGFAFPDGYNKSLKLVIDPILVFATYSGGTGGGSGFYSYSTTYDQLGNMYAGSGAQNAGWPTTVGVSYQANWAAGNDVGINKYNALGSNLIYSTYYGGAGQDYPHSLYVNSANELIIAGSTTSANLATTAGADATLGGGTDIFICHLNIDGTALIGATYLGGSNVEPVAFTGLTGGVTTGLANQNTTSPVELLTSPNGDIWVVSNTRSNDFPVTANANQATFGGGNVDAVIVKMNSTCTSPYIYSSYLGGTGDEGIFSVQFNTANNLVIGGVTTSTDYPTTTGALNTAAPGGNGDGFVSILNPNTGAILNSTYIGTNNSDQVIGVQIDADNNIYAFGRTMGNYPISAGVYNIAGGDVFIDKLNPTLTASMLSTRLGAQQSGGTRYFPTAYLLDICGNTYVCGLSATAGLPTTPDAFATAAAPFWFSVLNQNFASPLYQSYFGLGTDHTHTGTNRLDPTGIVYHSICNIQQYPFTQPPIAQNTPYAPNKLNTGQDIVSFKFNFEATGVNSNFELDPVVSGNDTGCAPYQVHFINTSVSAETYVWDFGDGSPTSSLAEPIHVFNTAGVYTVSLHANNDSSCITDDTAFITITVLQVDPPDFNVHDTVLCTFEQSIHVGATINNPSQYTTIEWSPLTGIIGANNTADIVVDPSVNNMYSVTVKNTAPGNICEFEDTKTVNIDLAPRVLDILNSDTVVCQGAIIPITAVGTPGYTYTWSPSTGVSDSSILSPNITINQPNFYTLTGSYADCPDTSVTINIGMQFNPQLTVSEDKFVCQGTDVTLESDVTPFRNDYIYSWTPLTSNLTTPDGPNTHLIVDSNITYYLSVKTPIGCADADTVAITVYPIGFGSIISDTGYCSGIGGYVDLWANGGTTYEWSPSFGLSATNIANPVANPPTSTEYTVLIRNEHNCLDTEKVSVEVYPAAVINIPDSVNVYPGENYQIESATNCSYFTWFPTSGLDNSLVSDPHMSPEVRTRYFVTATTEHGCTIKDSIDILVQETVLDMPNAFRPGNNANPVFKPSRRGIAKLNSFTIYNRWGNKVYSSTNIDAGWDGTYNGVAQPLGVYMYVIDAVSNSGKTLTMQGNVTLLR